MGLTSQILPTARTSLPLGSCPPGTALGSKLTGTILLSCLGDSLTADPTNTPANSFRNYLYLMAVASGLSVQFIGSQNTGDTPSNFHRGFVGSTVPDHMLVGSGGTGVADDITYLSGLGTKPDVLIIHLGMNDSSSGALTTNFASNLQTYVTQLGAIKTFRYVLVVPPHRGDPALEPNMLTVQAAVLSVATTLQGLGYLVAVADARGLEHTPNAVSNMYDRSGATYIHPIKDGNLITAGRIWPAFLNATGRPATWVGDGA